MQAIAEALLEGDCYSSSVATRIVAETSGDFGVIEGCERDDFSFGDASGSTSGSTAEGVRSPCDPTSAHTVTSEGTLFLSRRIKQCGIASHHDSDATCHRIGFSSRCMHTCT